MTTERRPLRLDALMVVAAGGVVGALLRWSLDEMFPVQAGRFPATTFAINVVGSVLLALLPASSFVRRRPLLPLALGTGVLGGFTTLSATSEEGRALLAGGHTGLATAYLVGTLAACLLGVALADRVTSLRQRTAFEAEEGDL